MSGVDASLCQLVARNVAKTVKLFCVKCEQLLVTDGDASQVIGTLVTLPVEVFFDCVVD